jgi:hypothetical protein
VGITKIKRKINIDQNDFSLKETSTMNLNFTIDHRFLDGSLAGKIAAEVYKYFYL